MTVGLLLLLFAAGPAALEDVEKIAIDTSDYFILGIRDFVRSDKGGYYASAYSAALQNGEPSILRLDSEGKMIARFDARGDGPGELRSAVSLELFKGRLYTVESIGYGAHVYDENLNHVTDYKLRSAGNLVVVDDSYLGVWNTREKDGKIFMLALNRLDDLSDMRLVHEIPQSEEPVWIQRWGGVSVNPAGGYIMLQPNKYEIRFYNANYEETHRISKAGAGHILPYVPFKGDPQNVRPEDIAWLDTFTKFERPITDGKVIVVPYVNKRGESYFDVLSMDGKYLARKVSHNYNGLRYIDGDVITGLTSEITDEENDERTFYIVRRRILNLAAVN